MHEQNNTLDSKIKNLSEEKIAELNTLAKRKIENNKTRDKFPNKEAYEIHSSLLEDQNQIKIISKNTLIEEFLKKRTSFRNSLLVYMLYLFYHYIYFF